MKTFCVLLLSAVAMGQQKRCAVLVPDCPKRAALIVCTNDVVELPPGRWDVFLPLPSISIYGAGADKTELDSWPADTLEPSPIDDVLEACDNPAWMGGTAVCETEDAPADTPAIEKATPIYSGSECNPLPDGTHGPGGNLCAAPKPRMTYVYTCPDPDHQVLWTLESGRRVCHRIEEESK